MSPDERDSRGAANSGARPEGAQDERAARESVRQMFSRIAPRYDFLNHFLSLSLDRVWRRRTARRFAHVLSRPGVRVLDMCCGTGDLAFALERESKSGSQQPTPSAEIWGCDFAHPMLIRAAQKASGKSRVQFIEADALQLPFADASFDLVTAAFGFRNLSNYDAGLREIYRVLKPGAEAGILEFANPRSLPVAPLYRFYFTHILPRIGGAVSGSGKAYRYLPDSVSKFPTPEALAARMRAVGFVECSRESWTLGIVALFRGKKRGDKVNWH